MPTVLAMINKSLRTPIPAVVFQVCESVIAKFVPKKKKLSKKTQSYQSSNWRGEDAATGQPGHMKWARYSQWGGARTVGSLVDCHLFGHS